MERTPVDSSAIASVGYDPESRKLHVEFHSGKVHEYTDVEPETHASLLAAPSIGAHFSKHIRPHYPSQLIT